jgi:imidazolonepropionase-like amidohydrolase
MRVRPGENAGLVALEQRRLVSDGDQSLLVDTLFDRRLTAEMLEARGSQGMLRPSPPSAPAAGARGGEGDAARRTGMKRACVVIVCVLLGPAAFADEPALLLEHATLIDGTGAPARPATSILIEAGRVRGVYPDGSRPRPKGATAEDLSGRFVMPGLIDAHVHLTDEDTTPEQYRTLLRALLEGGVTGVRDMAGDARVLAYLAREAQLDRIASPDIAYSALLAGPAMATADPRSQAATRGLLPGTAAYSIPVSATTDVALAIAEAKGTGATGVKLYADLPAVLVRELAAQAHRQGLLVWTHATIFPAGPQDAVEAGADTLSHAAYLVWEAAPRIPGDYALRARGDFAGIRPDDPRILALLDAMKARGTILDATVAVFVDEAARRPDAVAPGIGDWSVAVTRLAHERGVLIDAGTDSAGLPFSAITKDGVAADAAPAIRGELEALVDRCGFTPLQAIHAATQVSAMALGAETRQGAVVPGLHADLVVLAADPSADIRNLSKIVAVYKNGKAHVAAAGGTRR